MLLLLLFVWCGLHQRVGVNSSATLVQEPAPGVAVVAPSTLPGTAWASLEADPKPPLQPSSVIPATKVADPAANGVKRPPVSPSRPALAPARVVPPPPPLSDEPVSFEATTLDGAAFSLQKLRGKVVLVDLISVHCGYCFEELDNLQDLKRRYPEVVVVAVAAGETEQEVRTSLDARDLPFPFPVIADPQSRVLEVLPSHGTPTHVVLDREGRFSKASVVIGVNQPAVLERVVRVASGLPARKVVTARKSEPLE